MSVFRRILVKIVLFLLVVVSFGGAGAALMESRRASSDYAVEQYANHLIANEKEGAYGYLEMDLEDTLSYQSFEKAAEARKYGLYAGFHLEKQEARLDEMGNEFQDYKITYVNSDDEVQAEETITAKKQSQKKYYFFDQWKVLADHCMVKEFTFTVPAGSQVTVDGRNADSAWLVEKGEATAKDTYRIPEILPGMAKINITHPIFETVEEEVDTTKQTVDLCKELQLSEAGKASCLEAGVQALREFYLAMIKETDSELGAQFASGKEDVWMLAKEQKAVIQEKADVGEIFQSLAVSEYNPRYGEISCSEDENGILVKMDMGYHYLGKYQMDVVTETGEYDENGYAITQESVQTVPRSGDSTVSFTLRWLDGTWQIEEIQLPLIMQE